MNRAQVIQHAGNHRRTGSDPTYVDTVLQTFNASGTLQPFTGASKWHAPYAGALDLIHVGLGTAPTGGSVAFQANRNGSSIGTVSIAAGTLTGTFIPTIGTFSSGDYFSFDQTSGGTALGAKNLASQFWGHWR